MNSLALIQTNMGNITVELYEKRAPITAKNFVDLAKRGYYDGLFFHRVIKDFMIQGGDPRGNGTGGEAADGGTIPDEFHEELTHVKGALSMANAGPNTGGSQFFIIQAGNGTPHLNGKHSVFGRVTEGLEVVDAIAGVPADGKDKPLNDVIMNKVQILDSE